MAPLSFLLALSLPVLILVLRLPSTASTGTAIAFYTATQYTGSLYWVVPDLASASPVGCSTLTQSPASAKFTWAASTGKLKCDYVIFYASSSCTPSLDGSESIVKASGTSTAFSNFLYSASYSKIPTAKALRCAVKADPCAAGCSDSYAQCTALSTKIQENSTVSYTVYLNKDCSTCKPGYAKSAQTGLCTFIDPCASATCPADATCDSSTGVAVCQCKNDDYVYSPSLKICQDHTAQIWLTALNGLRPTVPALTWSNTLATSAQAGAGSQACPPGSPVTFTKVNPGSPKAFSENDAYLTSSDESSVVNLWMGSSFAAPRSRMTSKNSTNVGCAKSLCQTSAGDNFYFVCLFSPFTYWAGVSPGQ